MERAAMGRKIKGRVSRAVTPDDDVSAFPVVLSFGLACGIWCIGLTAVENSVPQGVVWHELEADCFVPCRTDRPNLLITLKQDPMELP